MNEGRRLCILGDKIRLIQLKSVWNLAIFRAIRNYETGFTLQGCLRSICAF